MTKLTPYTSMRALLLFAFITLVSSDWRNQYPGGWAEDSAAITEGALDGIRFWYQYKTVAGNPAAYQTCREIIGYPPTATFTYHQPGSGSRFPTWSREYTFEPRDERFAPLRSISKCCTASCGTVLNLKVVEMQIGFTKETREPFILDTTCTYCERIDTSKRNCSNGEYASNYLNVDDEDIVVNQVQCLPCPPGTWMTCMEKSACSWPIPQSASAKYNPGKDFWMPKDYNGRLLVPVGSCLPCEYAGGSKSHYGDDLTKSSFIMATPSTDFLTTSPSQRTQGLPWHCPGGASAPRMCNVTDTQGDPLTSDKCVCRLGLALRTDDTCQPCPRGNRCNRGFADACPDHTHQPLEGQTECLNCTSDGTERGAPMAYCGQNMQLRKCTGVHKASPMQCVNCNQCRKMYLPSNAEGKVDCYN